MNDESINEESPHSVQSDNFTQASILTPSNNQKKVVWKASDLMSEKSSESLTEEEIIEESYW